MANRWTWAAIVLAALASTGEGQEAAGPTAPPAASAAPPNAFVAPSAPPPEFCPPPAGLGLGPVTNPLPDNGFTEHKPCPGYRCFVNLGTQALRRQNLGNSALVIIDPGVNIPGVPSNVDTGNLPRANSPMALNFDAVVPGMNWGARVDAGVVGDFGLVEFSGFYLAEHSWGVTRQSAGRLDLPFGFFPAPIGFQGNNNLWLQADRVDATYEMFLASAELNYRCFLSPNIQCITGVRYLDLLERFSIATNDDGLVAQPLDLTNVATVASKVHNRIVGPQLGMGYTCDLSPETLTIGAAAKGCWGVNWMEGTRSLVRGDGFTGFEVPRRNAMFSHLYELSFHLDWWFPECCRIRGGYNLLWVVNIPEAHEQINFNLGAPDGNRREQGSIFFHGPMVEVMFVF